ncbi:hypothetical protein [Flavobacterium ovatum]|uniref:hypothetical protein n=1 Tax=Flavobacterium ovatum TaxID=1928857 RepID=UPI00344E099C
MKKIKLTNEELNYLDSLIIEINSKLQFIKNNGGCEDGMDGGIRCLLFFIQTALTYPESEEYFTYDEGEIVALTYIINFSNEQIFFIIKILEDEQFKDVNLFEEITRKTLKKFKKNTT